MGNRNKMSECFDINSLSCTLKIDMDQAPRALPNLLNRFEQPDAKLISCKMNSPATFTDDDDIVDLTPLQLSSKACVESTPLPATIYLTSNQADVPAVKFTAVNGAWFTVQELLDAIGAFETAARPQASWFGGVDTHHVYLEELPGEEEDYVICSGR